MEFKEIKGKKHYLYESLLNRLDNALIEKELLNDEIQELKKEKKELKETIERIKISRQFERVNNINLGNKGGENA